MQVVATALQEPGTEAAPPPPVHARGASAAATAAAFALPLVLYLLTATRTVQGGDTGEFALIAGQGGTGHPPGYPLYSLLLRAASVLPFGTPAFRAAMVSAVAGAASVAVLARVLLRLGVHPAAALVAVLAHAVSPLAWKLAGLPEVFTLNALLAAGILLAVLRLREAGAARASGEAALVGLLFGLGMANHHTIVFCLPLIAWGLLGRTPRLAPAPLLAAAGGVLAGLLPYAYVLLAARSSGEPGRWSWGAIDGVRALVGHFLRREYGTFRLSLKDFQRDPLDQVAASLTSLVDGWFYLFFALGLWGAVVLWRRQRGFALALGTSFALAALLFPAVFNLPLSSLARAVAQRFHLLGSVLFAVAVGVGVDQGRQRLSRPLATAVLVVVPLLATLRGLGQADWRARPTIERYLASSLRSAAPGAVIFGEGDIGVCGFRYVSQVRGIRPDVRYVDVHLLRQRWYHDRVLREVPQLAGVPFDPQITPLRSMLARLSPQVPTYLTFELARTSPGLNAFPAGLLLRVASAQPPPPPEVLEPRVEQALAALLPLPAPIDPWAVHTRALAAQPLSMLASAYEARGDRAHAQRCRTRAAALTSDAPLSTLPAASAGPERP